MVWRKYDGGFGVTLKVHQAMMRPVPSDRIFVSGEFMAGNTNISREGNRQCAIADVARKMGDSESHIHYSVWTAGTVISSNEQTTRYSFRSEGYRWKFPESLPQDLLQIAHLPRTDCLIKNTLQVSVQFNPLSVIAKDNEFLSGMWTHMNVSSMNCTQLVFLQGLPIHLGYFKNLP